MTGTTRLVRSELASVGQYAGRAGLCHVLLGLSLVFAGSAWAGTPTSAAASPVVVKQGGAQVTLQDVDTFAGTIPPTERAKVFASPERIETLLRNMLADKQLLAEAHALKLDQQPDVAAAMQAAANHALVAARVKALRAEVAAHVPDMTELARERYMSDPSAFAVPEVVDVKHILIGTKDRSDAEAKALADKLAAELHKAPSQFDADVKQYSDDPSKAQNGGVIQNATSEQVVAPFREAAEKLKTVGQLIGPVKTQFGYHILQLVKITPAQPKSFDEVKADLMAKLKANYIDRKVQDHLDGLRSKQLDADMDLVKSLTTRYADKSAATK